jgi:hypothetical protein
MLAKVRAAAPALDDDSFLRHFYRFARMPGNFSLRHAVLGSLRQKHSPFLDTRFIEATYGLTPEWYADSRLHRAIIATARPSLVSFFDHPVESPVATQDWPARFAGPIGTEVYRLLRGSLDACEDVFRPEGVLEL